MATNKLDIPVVENISVIKKQKKHKRNGPTKEQQIDSIPIGSSASEIAALLADFD